MRPRPPSSHPKLARGALLFLGVLVGALAAAELGLELFAPVSYRRPSPVRAAEKEFQYLHRAATLPGLEYEMTPDAAVGPASALGGVIHTNSFGMRGPEITLAKPEGVTRVAVVGDSYAFGLGVLDDETYASVLERELEERAGGARRYEVLNFGVTGYSTFQEALVVRHRALAFAPDLVLVGYVLNDPETHPTGRLHEAFHRAEWWQRFDLMRLCARWRHECAIERAGGPYRYFHSDAGGWQTVVAGFADIAAACAEAHVPVAVALFPQLSGTTWEGYPFHDLHQQVAELARARGFAVLDLIERLPGHAARPCDLVFADNQHPNPAGHRACAEELATFLGACYPALFAAADVGALSAGN